MPGRQETTHFGHPTGLLAQLFTDEKRASIRTDVQVFLAEPFPGTVAQGVSLPKV